ncbi:unnamed protein product [Gulo gulo]|uniref:Uncharacterized protein n=1 Tax=Gulo gulo TaxID=48420 RepID=A0A9X9LVM9_GULGU|nr:unnamed protein product [Gulo gulo]
MCSKLGSHFQTFWTWITTWQSWV